MSFSGLQKCLEGGRNFAFGDFLKSLENAHLEQSALLHKSFIKIGHSQIYPVNESEIWYGIYHDRFGLCLNMNLAKSQSLEYKTLKLYDATIFL